MIYEGIARHAGLFTEYTELRVQENRELRIALLNGDAVRNSRSATSGCSARVYKEGVWGFASFPRLDDQSVARAVSMATENARFLASREKRGSPPLPRTKAEGTHDLSTTKRRLSQKDYMDFVRAVDSYLAEKGKGIASRTVSLYCDDMEKTFIGSDGSVSQAMNPRSILYAILSAEAKAGDSVELMEIFDHRGQFEDVFGDPAELYPRLDRLLEELAAKAEGVYPEAGLHEVVLGPDLAGILAHEAIGHTVEADLVLGGSVAADFMDREVASGMVSLVDFAHEALGKPCPVPLWVDDEGTAARDAVLIDKGVLKSYMHNKESAAHFGVAPTGNARAYAFSDEPLIRMRNTAILPGTSRVEDMIASVDEGYYLVSPGGGQADSTSEFMFGVVKGYEIQGGKLARALRDTTVSGIAFDMLKTVTMLSDDMSWVCAGFCGKKQPMPVGMGGPAIKCKITLGGR
jgi:TldD protein